MKPFDPEIETAVGYIARLEAEVVRLNAERLKLDRRIHNQRVALRENWQIVEQRRKWLGCASARRQALQWLRLLKESRAELARQQRPLDPDFQRVLAENRWDLYSRS